MERLLVHVEGQTEETFVNEILAPYLQGFGYTRISARLLGHSRHRSRRGGIVGWNVARRDLLNHLKEDPACVATTMVDYYALPGSGEKAWPGREEAGRQPFVKRAAVINGALHEDVCNLMGPHFDQRRFVPNVIMHEFEGLLFSHCEQFASGIGKPELATHFQEIRNSFASPEEINDSELTAPSKRIEKLVKGYQKTLHGPLAILSVGLENVRNECTNFREWIERLEALGG